VDQLAKTAWRKASIQFRVHLKYLRNWLFLLGSSIGGRKETMVFSRDSWRRTTCWRFGVTEFYGAVVPKKKKKKRRVEMQDNMITWTSRTCENALSDVDGEKKNRSSSPLMKIHGIHLVQNVCTPTKIQSDRAIRDLRARSRIRHSAIINRPRENHCSYAWTKRWVKNIKRLPAIAIQKLSVIHEIDLMWICWIPVWKTFQYPTVRKATNANTTSWTLGNIHVDD